MQKPFSHLSHQGQVRRLAALARSALKAYAFDGAQLSLLRHRWNTTFRVLAPDGDRYVLRIHHPGQTSVEAVDSELLWLSALRQETNLPVPEPVPNLDQHLVTVVATSNIPQPRLCVLFRWLDGRFIHRDLTPGHLFQVGSLMAQLHHHATSWQCPASFSRLRVDNLIAYPRVQNDDFDSTIAATAVWMVTEVSTSEAGTVVAEVIRRVWSTLQTLGREPEVFGLIHGDLHQWNYLFRGGAAAAIDFDDCGYGHWLYDLAVTLTVLQSHQPSAHYPALRHALLAGYRQTRALSDEHETYLNTFIALRRLQDLLCIVTERNHPVFRDLWQSIMTGELQSLRTFTGDLS